MNELTLKALANTAIAERPFDNPLFPPSPYYRFLKHLAAEIKPQLSIVLGVCGGGCCLHLAQGYGMGMVIGIDIAYDHPEQISYIKSNHSNFSLWLGDSVDSAFEVFKDFGYADIVFIDTIHTRQRTIQEFEAWQGFVKSGGVGFVRANFARFSRYELVSNPRWYHLTHFNMPISVMLD